MWDAERISELMQQGMEAARVPGAALAVLRGDELIYARSFGVEDVESGRPVTPDTVFRVGSVSKPLTATMILRLAAQNILSMDRPVAHYLPRLRFAAPRVEHFITLRSLLSHTSGLPTALYYDNGRDPATLEDYVYKLLPRLRLLAPPDTFHYYSNPGYVLAGYIAQQAAGRPYAQLMQELIFDPLEMTRSSFDPQTAQALGLARSHELDAAGRPAVRPGPVNGAGQLPCGFAFSTLHDLVSFARLHLNEGLHAGRRLLSRWSVRAMQRPHTDCKTLDGAAYGLGMRIYRYKGLEVVGHSGAIDKYGAVLRMLPAQGVAVIIVCNRAPQFWGAMGEIVRSVFDALLDLPPDEERPPEIISLPRTEWARLAGAYLGPASGLVLVHEGDEGLSIEINGGPRVPLQPVRPDLFYAQRPDGGRISVGFVGQNYLLLESRACTRSTYTPCEGPSPPEYAGTFVNDLDTFTLRVAEGRLWCHSEDEQKEYPCIMLDEKRFACDMGLLEFEGPDAFTWARAFPFVRRPG